MGEARERARRELAEDQIQRLMQAQELLAGYVRSQGRIRVPSGDIAKVGPGSRLQVRTAENGDVIVTYLGDGEG